MKVIIVVGAAAIAAGALWADKLMKDYERANYYQAVAAQSQAYAVQAPVTQPLPDMAAQARQNLHDRILADEIAR